MTIAIGLICKECIILASDSQMTAGGYKALDEKKVFSLKLTGNVKQAAIAVSGDITAATHFRERLNAIKDGRKIKLSAQLPAMVRQAMKETREIILDFADMKKRASGYDCTEYLKNLRYRVILAYFFDGRPFIYTFDSVYGIPRRSYRAFEAIGCGDSLARFILTGDYCNKLGLPDGLGLSIYTIEACKKHFASCGGKFQFLLISAKNSDNIMEAHLEPETVGAYSEAALRIDGKFQMIVAHAILEEVGPIMDRINQAWIDKEKALRRERTILIRKYEKKTHKKYREK